MKSGAFIVITVLYAHWESPMLAPLRFGYILTLLNLSTLIYPVTGIVSILSHSIIYCTYAIRAKCACAICTYLLITLLSWLIRYLYTALVTFVLFNISIWFKCFSAEVYYYLQNYLRCPLHDHFLWTTGDYIVVAFCHQHS